MTEAAEVRRQPAAAGLPWWKEGWNRARVLAAGLSALAIALLLDAWIRLLLGVAYRRDDARKVRWMNGIFHAWGRATFGIVRATLGVRLHVEGVLPPPGRYFILCNHQSSLDIPALISVFRTLNLKFVAMGKLRHGAPCVSVALRNSGCVFVDKVDLGADLAAIQRFAADLPRHDGSPLIFPEGRKSIDGSVLPFQWAGVEVIRAGSRLPLLPVTLDGTYLAKSILDLRGIVGGTVTIRIGEPIPFEDVARDRRGAYQRVEETIRGHFDAIRAAAGA